MAERSARVATAVPGSPSAVTPMVRNSPTSRILRITVPSIGARSSWLSKFTRARSRRARATCTWVRPRSRSAWEAAPRPESCSTRASSRRASAYSASARAREARASSLSMRAIRSPAVTRWLSSTGISTILPWALLLTVICRNASR